MKRERVHSFDLSEDRIDLRKAAALVGLAVAIGVIANVIAFARLTGFGG